VSHRLARAGGNPGIFTSGAIKTLYRLSKGTPRLINVIADRAMLGAYVENGYQVTASLVRGAAREVFGGSKISALRRYVGVAAVIVVATLALMAWAWLTREPDELPRPAKIEARLRR